MAQVLSVKQQRAVLKSQGVREVPMGEALAAAKALTRKRKLVAQRGLQKAARLQALSKQLDRLEKEAEMASAHGQEKRVADLKTMAEELVRQINLVGQAVLHDKGELERLKFQETFAKAAVTDLSRGNLLSATRARFAVGVAATVRTPPAIQPIVPGEHFGDLGGFFDGVKKTLKKWGKEIEKVGQNISDEMCRKTARQITGVTLAVGGGIAGSVVAPGVGTGVGAAAGGLADGLIGAGCDKKLAKELAAKQKKAAAQAAALQAEQQAAQAGRAKTGLIIGGAVAVGVVGFAAVTLIGR